MAAKILLVQSRITPHRIDREQGNFRRAVGGAAELGFLSALDERFSWGAPHEFLADYDGVMFGGSSDFDFHGGRPESDPVRKTSQEILTRTRPLVAHAFESGIPILGVCFGHQIIGEMHQGMVTNDREQSKFGAYKVALTEEGKSDPLFSALPENFYAQYAHKDSVTNLPEGATLLATGDACRFSALRYGDHIYTVQFHPEIQRFIQGASSHDSPEASKLVQLWIERIVMKRG